MTDRIDYLRVRCHVHHVSRNAVAIAAGAITTWIPLSLVHTLDERTLTSGTVQRGDEMTLRIVDWKVGQLGLPTEASR